MAGVPPTGGAVLPDTLTGRASDRANTVGTADGKTAFGR